ncbi:MAG: type sorting protein [Mucilaginibacter sp.]|nr:type sorting protein [Mucilaginibacter sp.]
MAMKRKLVIIVFLCLVVVVQVLAQKNCGTKDFVESTFEEMSDQKGIIEKGNSALALKLKLALLPPVINIPVWVHVLYHPDSAAQKISEQLIQEQIDELNRDFNKQNADIGQVPLPFRKLEADCGIHFKLAHAPDYVKTQKRVFMLKPNDGSDTYNRSEESIKFKDCGGADGVADTRYLNIWIGNITDGKPLQLLGYGTYPGHQDAFDGVVIYYKAIGPNADKSAWNRGRTLTHEVGHWLNLRHLWGDSECGDDGIFDTPRQAGPNQGSPKFSHFTCPGQAYGDLFMDYMDQVDDSAMLMFTDGQRDWMRSNFIESGGRSSFLLQSAFNLASALAGRNDQHTPVVTNLHDAQSSAQGDFAGKKITWTAVKAATQYKVLINLLGSSRQKESISKTATVKLNHLKPGSLYQISIQTVTVDGKLSSPSTPYLFQATKQ